MKARPVVLTVEVISSMTLKDIKAKLREAITWNLYETTVKQIQINVIQGKK